jgi:hypothetical protein
MTRLGFTGPAAVLLGGVALVCAVASARAEIATYYGGGYEGRPLGCGGTYSSMDPTIVAVGPSRYAEFPCGTVLHIEGPAGSIVGVRQDSCPGCSYWVFDLSDEANRQVCGSPAHTCTVTISRP